MKKVFILGAVVVLCLAAVLFFKQDETKVAENKAAQKVTITCLAGATPHAEILDYIKDDLAAAGIVLDIQSRQWDATWNERVNNGETDFHYDAYIPYLDEWNKANAGHLIGLGKIHMEPLVMMSDKFKSIKELPDNAKIAIKEDVTNQYRALRLLEQAGLIVLADNITLSNADVSYIKKYNKPIKVIAMDADVIMNMRQDMDAYITNTNRILEAGLDPNIYLARENAANSNFANVIAVNEKNKDNPNILKVVQILETDKVRKFINDKYKGAVIPAF